MIDFSPAGAPGQGVTRRLRQLSGWQRVLLSALMGVVMTLGHAPTDLPWGFFLALPVVLAMTAEVDRPRQAAWIGWGLGLGYFISGLHWIGHAFLVDPDQHAWMLPFALTLLPGFLALFWAGAFWLAKRIWPQTLALQALVLASSWTLVEIARGHVLTGFPWALPAYAWVETPLLQSASWAGPFGLTLIVLFLCSYLPMALLARSLAGTALAAAGFAGLWIWGTARVPETVTYAPDAPLIRIVQPDAPQHLKWNRDYIPRFYRRLLEASAAPLEGREGTPDLILWPETAVAYLPERFPEGRQQIAAAARGAPVVTGAITAPEAGAQIGYFNSLVTILPDASMGPSYNKHHLVPFGEYVPFAWILKPLGLEQIALFGGFDEGPGPATISLPGLPSFAAAICYEMIFPHEIVGTGPRPDWIVTITNDAWFGGFAGPQQHLDQARFRAVEQGLPAARAANTGISAMIDPYGRVTNSLPLHTHGAIDVLLPEKAPETLFSQMRWTSTIGLIALILAFLTVFARQSRQIDKS
ncbi:MAG: apolipoprotein N-acyltransferase [Pseudomonadota bacterium]